MIQDSKIEIQTIKKTQTKGILEAENIRKWSGTTNTSMNNRIQEMEEINSSIEDTKEETDS